MKTSRSRRSKPRSVTLWSQHVPHPRMLELTVGDDRRTDQRLLSWDILGSLGHIEGLRASGLLGAAEHRALQKGLRDALAAAASGRLAIGAEHEDAHSAVEHYLVRRIGRVGATLHTGRSRNDQIACDLRLWLKHSLLEVHARTVDGIGALLAAARRHRRVLFPGYTHGRKAMPSSLGLWAAGHAAGLIDTIEALPAVWAVVDRSPLGSAAGYGVPLTLDREATARALGFAAVETPVTAVQNGRGKIEAAVLFWCAQLGHDAAKAASDVLLFSGEEYGYLVLDPSLATGSSLMPHKRNPDLFELIRARAAALDGDLSTLLALRAKLTSGYHRDFQMMKEPLFRGVARAAEMLEMLQLGVAGLRPDRKRCAAALTGGVLTTGAALSLAARGTPFREAYREVSRSLARGKLVAGVDAGGVPRTEPLGLDELRRRMRAGARFARRQERRFSEALERLAGSGTLPAGVAPRRGVSRV